MLSTIARKVLSTIKWICLGLIVAILINYVANIAPTPAQDFVKNFSSSVFGSLFLPGRNLIITLSTVGFLIAITLLAAIILLREKRQKSDKMLRRYLQAVIEANQGLNPRGFAQQSQALISVNVPLDDIFIHLHAVRDRPIYDVPSEQQKLLEELRQRTDLSAEDQEELIQRLRVIWYSQVGQKLMVKRQKRNISIARVLRQLDAANPVAVILGTPGSGKSTAMRWLALHMARAFLSPNYDIPDEPDSRPPSTRNPDIKQIPILLRISDYAKRLSVEDNLSFKQFFKYRLTEMYSHISGIADRLLAELSNGRCLVLFDGLDEVASDDLRRRVAQEIHTFIFDHAADERSRVQHYNSFIITSRIVGYEPGTFAEHAHYTLLDLEDEQIERFLDRWCPAVERYQAMFEQNMKPLTSAQEASIKAAGAEQRDHLLDALENNSGIKRLAVNPLMLTILALIQRSGKTLPHRRVELYQIVTRTLLDNWNKETGRRTFPIEEVPLAEQLLGELAYKLHSSDPVLTEQNVKSIARQTMVDFYGHSTQIRDSDIKQFIETLRSSSGLFIESGQGLFSFMHRTFQEYFVALYLLRKTAEELKQAVVSYYHSAIWREPLLLTIAYKSGQSSRSEKQEASDLIRAIAHASDTNYTILCRSLLFAASSLVDCNAWSIDKALQHTIANRIFDIYGDALKQGRYTQLKQEIEDVALLWLRGQPAESSQKNTSTPLLETWCAALHNCHLPARQEGAAHLLASIASELSSCPVSVRLALLPSLLKLTNLPEFSQWYDSDISLPSPTPLVPPRVEYYAWETLRLLDAPYTMTWLRTDLDERLMSQPELVELREKRIIELNIPFNSLNPLYKYLLSRLIEYEAMEASKEQRWYMVWQNFLRQEMEKGRYVTFQVCLGLQLLLCEDNESQRQDIVNELMAALLLHDQQHGQTLITIASVYLEELLYRRESPYDDDDVYPMIPAVQVDRLGSRYRPRTDPTQYLTRHRSIWQKLRDRLTQLPFLSRYQEDDEYYLEDDYDSNEEDDLSTSFQRPFVERAWRPRRRVAGTTQLPRPRSRSSYPVSPPYRTPGVVPWKSPEGTWRRLREKLPRWMPFALRDWTDGDMYLPLVEDDELLQEDVYALPLQPSSLLQPPRLTPKIRIWRDVPELQDMEYWLEFLEPPQIMLAAQDKQELRNLLQRDTVVQTLCGLLQRPVNVYTPTVLLSLYIVLTTYDSIPALLKQNVKDSFQIFEGQTQQLTTEHRLLLTAICYRIKDSTDYLEAPDIRASALYALKKQQQLTGPQVERILESCSDTRRLARVFASGNSTASRRSSSARRYRPSPQTVHEIVWEVLNQQFSLEPDAFTVVLNALDDDNAMICAAAALLLQRSRTNPLHVRKEAAQKITKILQDDILSRRQLDIPDGLAWRLDDILFDTLKVLAE